MRHLQWKSEISQYHQYVIARPLAVTSRANILFIKFRLGIIFNVFQMTQKTLVNFSSARYPYCIQQLAVSYKGALRGVGIAIWINVDMAHSRNYA